MCSLSGATQWWTALPCSIPPGRVSVMTAFAALVNSSEPPEVHAGARVDDAGETLASLEGTSDLRLASRGAGDAARDVQA